MRITFVLPHAGMTGGIRVVAAYADRLRRRGHDVFVVSTPLQPPTLKERLKSLVRGNGWPKAPAHGQSHMDGLDVPWKILGRYRSIADRDVPDADVVVATWWETAEWVARLSRRKGIKAYLIQGDDRDAMLHDRSWIERVESTWRFGFHTIAVSEWVKSQIQHVVPDQAVEVVANGVDLSLFRSGPRGKCRYPTVGFMYSPSVHCKGTDLAIESILRARKKVSELCVVAFGHGKPDTRNPLPAETAYESEPQQVRIKECYAACDAWLFSSRQEGFGLPILEAMACRTPVIGTPAGVAPELISRGGGILVEHGNPQAMADAIVKICRMPGVEWKALSDAAYATARQYTWEEATNRLEQALERAVECSGRNELTGVA